MDLNPKFMELLALIREVTEAGQVHWEETVDEDMFRLVLDRGMILLGLEGDDVGENPVYFAILIDDKGKGMVDLRATRSENSLLPELVSLARKDVKKESDSLIEELIGEIEAKRPR